MDFLAFILDMEEEPAVVEFYDEIDKLSRRFLMVDDRTARLEKLLENLHYSNGGPYGLPYLRGVGLNALGLYRQGIDVLTNLVVDLEASTGFYAPIYIHRAKIMLSSAYLRVRDFAKALRVLEETIPNASSPKEGMYLRSSRFALIAQQHLVEERFEAAIQSANVSLRIQKNFDAYNTIGNAQRSLGRLNEALETLNRALQLSSSACIPRFNRGVVFLEMKEYESALGDFSKAIEVSPMKWEFYYHRAKAYLGLGRASSALEELVVAFQLTEPNVELLLARAEAREMVGDLQNALDDARHAVRLDSNHGFAREHLGAVLLRTGNAEAAIKEFEVAMKLLPPPQTDLLGRVGILHSRLGHYSRSISPLRTAAAASWNEGLRDVLVQVRCVLAQAMVRCGNFDDSLVVSSEIFDLASNEQKIQLRECQSFIYIVQGNYASALSCTSLEVELGGLACVLRFRRALILLLEHEGLRQALEVLHQLFPEDSLELELRPFVADLVLIDGFHRGFLRSIETAILRGRSESWFGLKVLGDCCQSLVTRFENMVDSVGGVAVGQCQKEEVQGRSAVAAKWLGIVLGNVRIVIGSITSELAEKLRDDPEERERNEHNNIEWSFGGTGFRQRIITFFL